MVDRQVLRYLFQHKLDPKVKYVVQKGKLVPAKKKVSLDSINKINEVNASIDEEVNHNNLEKTADSIIESTVNEQITDSVTQTIETIKKEKAIATSTTKKKKPSKNK